MNQKQLEILKEIKQILNDLHFFWAEVEYDHHKSQEGSISVYYNNWFEAEDYTSLDADGISIYSYLFGPSRVHDFDSFEEALEAVKQWSINYRAWVSEAEEPQETMAVDRIIGKFMALD